MYFDNCYTPEELKLRYRDMVKLLHPDKGGNKAQFQDMQNEYEQAKQRVNSQRSINTMPDLYSDSEAYEYMRRPVIYAGVVYNHYYKFTQAFGADILIDFVHIHLIKRIYAAIG